MGLTSSSLWGGNIYCSNGTQESSCSSVLNCQDIQFIEATEKASSSDGLGVDYDLYSGDKYIQHMHINYKMINGSLSPDLTNNAGGMIQLTTENDAVYIREVSVPTLAPVTSPPTAPPQPTLQPTSAAPTTNRPSAAPSTSAPSISLSPTSPPSSNLEQSAWKIDWTSWFDGPPFSIPSGVNLINIFVGKFVYDENGKPPLEDLGILIRTN